MNLDKYKQKIQLMTRDEKATEFRKYLDSGNFLKVDVDQIMADQAFVGAPDSAMDEALLRIAKVVGAMLATEPLTAEELAEKLKTVQLQGHGLRVFEPQLNLRRRRRAE